MRKRPWEILLLTILYLVAPFANLAYTCVVGGYALTDVLWVIAALGPTEALALVLYPLLALAVWSVSRTGWWAFLVINVLILGNNIWIGLHTSGANLWIVAGADLINLAVAGLLLTKHARSPYFSPRARWWNAGVRYQVASVLEVPVTVRQTGHAYSGHLLDVGPTGCFVELPRKLDMDLFVDVEFECWGLTLHMRGRPVRQDQKEGQVKGYGIRFSRPTPERQGMMKALVAVLKAHQVPIRGAMGDSPS